MHKNRHGLHMQRLYIVLHTAVAWQTVNELACGESGIVHGAECTWSTSCFLPLVILC